MGDFDFLAGRWNVANRRLKERLVNSTDWAEFPATVVCYRLFNGLANIDEISFPDGTCGLTLRLFDVERREWSLYWSSSQTGTLFPPVVGRFSNGTGEFYGDDTEGGTPVRVRFIWSVTGPDRAHWEQAFSVDGGTNWETNWTMDFARARS